MALRPSPLVMGIGWNFGIGSPAKTIRTLAISGTPVTTGTVDTPYTGFTVAASGGLAPYTYVVASGALPDGLALNATTGAVAGTPTTAETETAITIRVVDKRFRTADLAPFDITVSEGGGTANVLFGADRVLHGSDTVIFTPPE